MSKPNETWDQKDFLAATDALQIEAANLEALLSKAGKTVPTRPAATTSAIGSYDGLVAHMAKLRAMVALFIGPGAVSAVHGSAAAWNPDAQVAAAMRRERADDDDKPSDEKAGNCEVCAGTGRCGECNGSGKKPGESSACDKCEGDGRCPTCNGYGSTKEQEAGGQNGKAKAFDPDAAILTARGCKTVTELRSLGPTRFSED